ncbi:MAG TPA: YHS domain-containing protein, partial [Bacteroidia bacterium]|nr:YHS domain-containing protein [Bacteroidia bacterium]
IYAFFIALTGSCTIFKADTTMAYYNCQVCNKVVEKSNSYDYKYNGKKYHLDTYDCKTAFKMNPEKFIANSCNIVKSESAYKEFYMDPVCNMKVVKSNSFDYKYKGTFYHFDNVDCKEAFKLNPEKFTGNKCGAIQP